MPRAVNLFGKGVVAQFAVVCAVLSALSAETADATAQIDPLPAKGLIVVGAYLDTATDKVALFRKERRLQAAGTNRCSASVAPNRIKNTQLNHCGHNGASASQSTKTIPAVNPDTMWPTLVSAD
jgi:hypothetical protein